MNSGGGFTSILGERDRLEELAPEECRRLLALTQVGRLAYCTDFGPRVIPVNHLVAGEALIFRIGVSTEAARHVPSHAIAFEVDQFEASSGNGWSVLVLGQAHLLDYAAVRLLDIPPTPRLWPDGQRPLVLQVPLAAVTGRRVRPA